MGCMGYYWDTNFSYSFCFCNWISLAKKRIKNFYIDTRLGEINENYSNVVIINLRNHTNQSIYVISEGFKFRNKVQPSPNGAKDATSDVYEVKFEGREKHTLTEIDALIRPNQCVNTWIPIDPNNSEEEIRKALKDKELGVLTLKCLKIAGNRQVFVTLRLKIYERKYPRCLYTYGSIDYSCFFKWLVN